MNRTLSRADERRATVTNAAIEVFAVSGYRGTPVAEVAAVAGISPAYVFRLFPTKQDLFIAALHACFDEILAGLLADMENLPAISPRRALAALADAYADLITDRKLIMLQVHALAASDDPEIRDAMRAQQARLVEFVTDHTQAAQAEIQTFVARGQLCHLVAALDLDNSTEPWATRLTEGLVH
ncbi:TetR/AcrR family transcriptional regulator [Nocardia alni]|uniref:TetR/AcrR family transcriptional regulator n=1 Tax=Nocardia alni TaxID=2815723 RepID=UPI001C24808E|nr:TetR/AcrR family transcriptional regulator [Nocardia alni]